MQQMMRWTVYGAGMTDVGHHRDNNEDAWLSQPQDGLYVVADGMGGMAAGEVASRIAVDSIRSALGRFDEPADSGTKQRRQERTAWMRQAIAEANLNIHSRAATASGLQGMGCTIDVALFRDDGVIIGHVGDSRVYLLRQGELHLLTEDHTLAQLLVTTGAISTEDAAHHPQKNLLTRALGPMPAVDIDVLYFDVGPGDVFMLCSDGLHGEASFEDIRAILRELPVTEAPAALVRAALAAGGHDNVSVIVAAVTGAVTASSPIVGSARALAAIASSDLFADFTSQEMARVQQIAFGRHFAAGDNIITQGEVCTSVFLVVEGEHSVWLDGQPIGRGGVGDPLGDLSLGAHPAFVTTRAESPNTVLEFPNAELDALLDTEPALVAKLALAALKRTHTRLSGLATSIARYRRTYGPTPP